MAPQSSLQHSSQVYRNFRTKAGEDKWQKISHTVNKYRKYLQKYFPRNYYTAGFFIEEGNKCNHFYVCVELWMWNSVLQLCGWHRKVWSVCAIHRRVPVLRDNAPQPTQQHPVELQNEYLRSFTITQNAPTRAFAWLKAKSNNLKNIWLNMWVDVNKIGSQT